MFSRRTILKACTVAVALTMGFGAGAVSASEMNKVAVLFEGLYSPFWEEGHAALKAALAERDIEVLEAFSDSDDSRQFEQVRAMIANGVDGIIIVQTDSNAVIPAIRLANEADIPMVHFNRPPADSDAVSTAIVADNYAIATLTAERMVEVAKERGGTYKAAILIGNLGDPNAVHRRNAFNDVMAQNSDFIEVVARIPTEWSADKAFAGLQSAFQANPDINMLFSSSDFLIPQIRQVLTINERWVPVGEEGHVLFGSFDGDAGAYELLEQGYLDVDGVQDLYFEANLAINALERADAGESLESLILDPGFVIHQANFENKRDSMWGYQVFKTK